MLEKRSSGKRSTSRKSGERRCVSRASTLVSTLAASITTSTEESPNGSSIRICPENLLNRP